MGGGAGIRRVPLGGRSSSRHQRSVSCLRIAGGFREQGRAGRPAHRRSLRRGRCSRQPCPTQSCDIHGHSRREHAEPHTTWAEPRRHLRAPPNRGHCGASNETRVDHRRSHSNLTPPSTSRTTSRRRTRRRTLASGARRCASGGGCSACGSTTRLPACRSVSGRSGASEALLRALADELAWRENLRLDLTELRPPRPNCRG